MVMGSLPEQVDLAVIGGGVGGYFAAIRAAQLGMSVAIVEKDKIGGHCPNYACIPSKMLIRIADIFYDAQHSQQFGITASATIDAKKMLEWRMGVSKKLEDGITFLCKSNGIDVIKAAATFLSSDSLQLTNGVRAHDAAGLRIRQRGSRLQAGAHARPHTGVYGYSGGGLCRG